MQTIDTSSTGGLEHRGAAIRMTPPRDPTTAVVVSCFGADTGGGLIALDDDGRAHVIDQLSTTGLAADGDRLVRMLRGGDEVGCGPGEMLAYDDVGVVTYARIDELQDAHDVVAEDEHLLVASPASNSILWLDRGGTVCRRWKAPGNGDAWHLNGVLVHEGRLLGCAFGRFAAHRGWSGGACRGAGIIFELFTGRTLIAGLTCPHHPRVIDERWLVCNSGLSELLVYESPDDSKAQRVALRGFTRGLAAHDDLLLVGESAPRGAAGNAGTASIALVDRQTLRVVDRLRLPFREVYDIAIVPAPILSGLRTGFATNPIRVAETGQLDLFASVGVRPRRIWATGDPLPPKACRVILEGELPSILTSGETVEVPITVTNRGSEILVSAPPCPVNVSFRWLRSSDGVEVLGHSAPRTRLPRSLPPGETISARLRVTTPEKPGRHSLHVTLVQEGVAWFDDLNPANALVSQVEVVESVESDPAKSSRRTLLRWLG